MERMDIRQREKIDQRFAVPKVSVIIPTYNRPYLLRRALASVAAQTFKNFEILVVQNGEFHQSESVVEGFRRMGLPIRYLYEKKANAANARNIGILNAKGEYIAFLDDDDEWLPSKLERQVRVFDENRELGLVACRGLWMDESGVLIDEIPTSFFEEEITFKTFVKKECVIYSLSSVLIKRKCFDDIGLFNTKYSMGNDYEFYLRLSEKYGMRMIKEPLFRYYRHEENTTADAQRMWTEMVAVLKSLKPSEHLEVSRDDLRESIKNYGQHFHSLAVDAMDSMNYRKATECYLKAVECDPTIGLKISWSRFSNLFYRLLRPYLAVAYCALMSLVRVNSAHGGIH